MSTSQSNGLAPLVYRPNPAARTADIEYHQNAWTSGSQGGGKVPADFAWDTNPKQNQEEKGANVEGAPALVTK